MGGIGEGSLQGPQPHRRVKNVYLGACGALPTSQRKAWCRTECHTVVHCTVLRGRHSSFLSLWLCIFIMTNFLQMAVKCLEEEIPFGPGLGCRENSPSTYQSGIHPLSLTSSGPSLFSALIFKDG